MQKTIYVMASLCVLLFFSSCRKFEVIKDELNGIYKPNPLADYYEVSGDQALTTDNQTYLPFLFRKLYQGDGKTLRQLIGTYRKSPDGKLVRPYDTLNVQRTEQQIHYINNDGDTIVSMQLNASGKPISAQAYTFMEATGEKTNFTFLYNSNKLAEIKRLVDGVQQSYVKIGYEVGAENIQKLTFEIPGAELADVINYEYDYTKRPSAQFYPDEMQPTDFWKFLRYINLLPELRNEYILIKSYYRSMSEYDSERVYSDHKFDKDGKLISFNLIEREWGGPGTAVKWEVKWK